MDLIWLSIMSIGGMISLAIFINVLRSSSVGNQNTFLFLEALIVGFFVFLTIGAVTVLFFLMRKKDPAVKIRTISDLSVVQNRQDGFHEDKTFEITEN